ESPHEQRDHSPQDGLLALATAGGLARELLLRVPGRLPGLYLLDSDPGGRRHFHSWRDQAPARDLLELPDWGRVAESLIAAKLIYFSGITLSLYTNVGLGRFLAVIELARQQGA